MPRAWPRGCQTHISTASPGTVWFSSRFAVKWEHLPQRILFCLRISQSSQTALQSHLRGSTVIYETGSIPALQLPPTALFFLRLSWLTDASYLSWWMFLEVVVKSRPHGVKRSFQCRYFLLLLLVLAKDANAPSVG